MFENDDEKLKNIMKLKAELEKDLKKKGLLKEKSKESKDLKYDEEAVRKIKENITTSAHITEEGSLSIYDINFQDYDASIDSIEKTLRIFSQKTANLNWKLIFEGLSSMLSGDLKKAHSSFEQASGIEAQYNKLLTELYVGQDISQQLVAFVKNNPDSIYPLLLLLERELLKGTADGIEKVLLLLTKKSSFWNLIYRMYTNLANADDVAKAVREKGFASLILLLSVYIDNSRDYPLQNHTCLNVHKSYLKGETSTAPEWCLFGQLIIAARKYLSGYKIDVQKLRRFEKSPEMKLFLGFLHYNEKNTSLAREYFKAFETQVGRYKIYTKPLRHSKIGMEQFIAIPNDFKELAAENLSITDFLKDNTSVDLYISYRNHEFLRLVFSEKHCKINYR
ncbi:MAG: hypothetical protein ABDH59_02085 [Fervidobacterium sp.]